MLFFLTVVGNVKSTVNDRELISCRNSVVEAEPLVASVNPGKNGDWASFVARTVAISYFLRASEMNESLRFRESQTLCLELVIVLYSNAVFTVLAYCCHNFTCSLRFY
jgi:hypothetical protein